MFHVFRKCRGEDLLLREDDEKKNFRIVQKKPRKLANKIEGLVLKLLVWLVSLFLFVFNNTQQRLQLSTADSPASFRWSASPLTSSLLALEIILPSSFTIIIRDVRVETPLLGIACPSSRYHQNGSPTQVKNYYCYY